jgi:hypothetical protein
MRRAISSWRRFALFVPLLLRELVPELVFLLYYPQLTLRVRGFGRHAASALSRSAFRMCRQLSLRSMWARVNAPVMSGCPRALISSFHFPAARLT